MSKKKKQDETVAEWYERITGQRLGSLKEQGKAVINGTNRAVDE